MRFLMMLLMLYAPLSFAADPAACIQLGVKEKARFIKNTCGESVFVFWCHNSGRPEAKSGVCGTGKDFYRKRWVFKAGEEDSNSLSEPLGSIITFGACFGGYSSNRLIDETGGYECREPASDADAEVWLITAGAPSEKEACEKVQKMASKEGLSQACKCDVKSDRAVCKIQVKGPKPAQSVLGTIKRFIRDKNDASCTAANDCNRTGYYRGKMGIRG